ncbi:MAG: DUF4266 domain-containing protein [Acidobacteriota bacterium]|nr:DUF4266 domain-containing protein [Acidobacteriota bacterium]
MIQLHRSFIHRSLGQRFLALALGFGFCLSLGACATVQPYEREILSLEAMQADEVPCHRFERNIEVYREGAAGGNGGKSGGGCGCS